MAKAKYFDAFGELTQFDSLYSFDDLVLQEGATATEAVYLDAVTGNRIEIVGKGLSFEGGEPLSGRITKLTFANGEDESMLVVQKMKTNAVAWYGAYEAEGEFGMLNVVFKGRDTVIGSSLGDYVDGREGKNVVKGGAGDDYVSGGSGADKLIAGADDDLLFGFDGNDKMTGGPESDRFSFYGETGRDVIRDFDAVGGGGQQDYLTMMEDDALALTFRQAGKNLIVKFEDGDLVKLLGVKKNQFDIDDDIVFFDV